MRSRGLGCRCGPGIGSRGCSFWPLASTCFSSCGTVTQASATVRSTSGSHSKPASHTTSSARGTAVSHSQATHQAAVASLASRTAGTQHAAASKREKTEGDRQTDERTGRVRERDPREQRESILIRPQPFQLKRKLLVSVSFSSFTFLKTGRFFHLHREHLGGFLRVRREHPRAFPAG